MSLKKNPEIHAMEKYDFLKFTIYSQFNPFALSKAKIVYNFWPF